MHLANWKQNFLAARGLNNSDGRQLFRYRITEQEFNDLRVSLQDLVQADDINVVAAQNRYFPPLFVLYASDWWRREGQLLRWEPLMASLNYGGRRWEPPARGICVYNGLRHWGLDLNQHGRAYIGSIALQGGLPVSLLADRISARRLRELLLWAMRLARKTNNRSGVDLASWIAQRAEALRLPETYRQPVICTLLAEMVVSVCALIEIHNIGDAGNAITALDLADAHWRETFPLPLGDAANAIVHALVNEAIANPIGQAPPPNAPCVTVSRSLAQVDANTWRLQTTIEAGQSQSARQLNAAFPNAALQFRMGLTLHCGDLKRSLSLRQMAGAQGQYRVEPESLWTLLGVSGLGRCGLELTHADGQSWQAMTRDAGLDIDLPWIFVDDEGEKTFLTQGGRRIAQQKALVAIPADWIVEPADDGMADLQGILHDPNRSIYRVEGKVRFVDRESQVHVIRTGRSPDLYEWFGGDVDLNEAIPLRPDRIARGTLPELHGPNGRVPPGQIAWSNGYGPIRGRFVQDGECLASTRIIRLPANATVQYVANNAKSGSISLQHWNANAAALNSPGITLNAGQNRGDLTLDLTHKDEDGDPVAPVSVEIDLYWQNNPHPARLRFPFPAKGVAFLNSRCETIPYDSVLTVDEMFGSRVVIRCQAGEQGPWLGLNLVAQNPQAFPRRRLADNQRLDVGLEQHRGKVQMLLSNSDDLNACVQFRIQCGNDPVRAIFIGRFAAELAKDETNQQVVVTARPIDKPDALRALRLETPEDDAIELGAAGDNAWNFDPGQLGSGSWFIYPVGKNSTRIRPLMWSVFDQPANLNRPIPPDGAPDGTNPTLGAVQGIADPAQRIQALDQVIARLAENYCDPDWLKVDRLSSELSHLPLASLDLWRRFAQSTGAMAALAVRLGNFPTDFLRRFSQELPFMWEMVTYHEWFWALIRLREQCNNWFGNQNGSTMYQRRVDDLLARNDPLFPAWRLFLECASNPNFVYGGPADADLHQLLFGQDANAAVQHLIHRHIQGTWPKDAAIGNVITAYRVIPQYVELFRVPPFGFAEHVISAPIMLAALRHHMPDPIANAVVLIRRLRLLREFDPEWFDVAFRTTIQRFLARGMIPY